MKYCVGWTGCKVALGVGVFIFYVLGAYAAKSRLDGSIYIEIYIWYRLPVIVLNGANSIISVGLQPYASQGVISITTSLIALICGIIGSIELFFGIQRRLESDMIAQRDYYLLSVDIFKTLSLAKHNRPIPAKDYLEKSYNTYQKLIESSHTLARRIDDQLIPLGSSVVVLEPEQSIAD